MTKNIITVLGLNINTIIVFRFISFYRSKHVAGSNERRYIKIDQP